MTAKGSRFRHFLYVTIAVLSFMSGGISALPLSDDAKIWLGFTIGTVTAGLVTSRSYIDESAAQVPPVDPPPEPAPKPYQI